MAATYAAHDGTYGLDQYGSNDWIYRNDAGAQVKAGDTVSVWLQFAGSADGRAYFGFGSNATGTLSLVAAPNTGQLILQQNLAYGFTNLAAVDQTYQANHWYRLEVDWGDQRQDRRQAVRQQRHDSAPVGDRLHHGHHLGRHRFPRHRQRQVLGHRDRHLRGQHVRLTWVVCECNHRRRRFEPVLDPRLRKPNGGR